MQIKLQDFYIWTRFRFSGNVAFLSERPDSCCSHVEGSTGSRAKPKRPFPEHHSWGDPNEFPGQRGWITSPVRSGLSSGSPRCRTCSRRPGSPLIRCSNPPSPEALLSMTTLWLNQHGGFSLQLACSLFDMFYHQISFWTLLSQSVASTGRERSWQQNN